MGAIPAAPSFSHTAHGRPTEWNTKGATFYWGGRTAKWFPIVEGACADVATLLEFLSWRRGPTGAPVLKLLGVPTAQPDGWLRCGWLDHERAKAAGAETGEWVRAWHGSKFESLYSILYHGQLLGNGDDARQCKGFPAAPGVHVYKDELGGES